jgi:DNA-binding protein HU-beta
MTNEQLARALASRTGLPLVDTKSWLHALAATVTAGLKEDAKVSLSGLGTLTTKATVARVGRNPQTGDPVNIAAGVRVKFKAGKDILGQL